MLKELKINSLSMISDRKQKDKEDIKDDINNPFIVKFNSKG